MTETAHAPVVFVHGLWLHGSSWQPWVDYFTEAGYDASAPGWPGDLAPPWRRPALTPQP